MILTVLCQQMARFIQTPCLLSCGMKERTVMWQRVRRSSSHRGTRSCFDLPNNYFEILYRTRNGPVIGRGDVINCTETGLVTSHRNEAQS